MKTSIFFIGILLCLFQNAVSLHAQPVSIETLTDNFSDFRGIANFGIIPTKEYSPNRMLHVNRLNSEKIELLVQDRKTKKTLFRSTFNHQSRSNIELTDDRIRFVFSNNGLKLIFYFLPEKDGKYSNQIPVYVMDMSEKSINRVPSALPYSSGDYFHLDNSEPILWIITEKKDINAPYTKTTTLKRFNYKTGKLEKEHSTTGEIVYMTDLILEIQTDDKGKKVVNKLDNGTLTPGSIETIKLKKGTGINSGAKLSDGSYQFYLSNQEGKKSGEVMFWSHQSDAGKISEFNPDTLKWYTSQTGRMGFLADRNFPADGFHGTEVCLKDDGTICKKEDNWQFRIWFDGKGILIFSNDKKLYATKNFASKMEIKLADGSIETDWKKLNITNNSILDLITLKQLPAITTLFMNKHDVTAFMQLNDNQKSAIALTELDYFFDKYKMMDELKGLFRLSGSLTPEEIDQIVLQKKHRFAELSTHTIIVYGTWLAKQNRDYLYKAGAEGNKKRYNYLHSEAKYPKETSDFPGKKEILILLNELSSPYQYYNTKMLLEMAQQELANKNFTDGVIPISKAILSRDSVNTSAWYYLGMSYQNSAKPNEALAALDKAIQYDSSNIEALHEKYKIISNASLSKENYEKLIPLSKVLKNACLTNKSHRIADLYKEVLSTICKIELYGLENQEFYNLYKSASGKVAADAAAEFFKLIPAIKTNSSEISYAGILWNTAEKYKFVAEYKKDSLAALLSDSLCSELIRMGYKFPTAFSTRIDIQLSLPHRETACLEIIKEAKVIFPEDSSLIDAEGKVYFRLGSKCFKQKQYAECVDWLNKYVVSRKTPAPIAYQMLGYSLLHTRDYKNSIHYFQLLEQYFKGDKEELTAYFPNFYDVINYAKAPSNAVPEMKSNIEGIENEKQKMNEAINLVKQKKHYDAITILNSSDIYFTSIQSKKNRKAVNKQIGRINYLLENYEEALIKFQFALSLDSADGEIYKLISLTFQEQADLLNSEKIISKGLKVLPDDIHLAEASAFHWAANGDFAYKIKAFDVAAQCFSKSLEWSPEFAVAHLYLGLSLANINPEDRSYIKHLKKGLDLSPELEKDVPEIRQLIDGTFFTYFQTESADYSDPLEACKCTYVLNAAKDGKCMTVVRIQNTEWYYVLPCNNRTITPTDIVNLGTAACLTGQMREKGFRLW